MEIYEYTEFQQNPERNKDSRVHLSSYIKHPCNWANFHKKMLAQLFIKVHIKK